jgi:MFS family permease
MLTGLLSGAADFGSGNHDLFFGIYAGGDILVGVCMGVVMPTLQTMANNVVEPQRRGAANATFITAFDIGIGGGSMLLGLLAEFTSLKSMYLVSGGIMIAAVLFFFCLFCDFTTDTGSQKKMLKTIKRFHYKKTTTSAVHQ